MFLSFRNKQYLRKLEKTKSILEYVSLDLPIPVIGDAHDILTRKGYALICETKAGYMYVDLDKLPPSTQKLCIERMEEYHKMWQEVNKESEFSWEKIFELFDQN